MEGGLASPRRFGEVGGKGQGGIGSPGMVLQTPVEGAAGQSPLANLPEPGVGSGEAVNEAETCGFLQGS
ncbi:hypothetical protein AK812_SmicGene10340 [Symbiodinium microadriaticum]|uniref:Uncharacterized protein n=1 Tax=Symbiodinium microadriaticum TaxID=2951 RepID=A0A1Q9EG27_SYMMI|nr:hypothetical protein AK812_SmicGene10340 [Symbiodinium microadriaticum]